MALNYTIDESGCEFQKKYVIPLTLWPDEQPGFMEWLKEYKRNAMVTVDKLKRRNYVYE